MSKLRLKNDEVAIERLSEAQSAIDDYLNTHPNRFSEEEHSEFRGLLSERATALSEATGMKIHSLFDD